MSRVPRGPGICSYTNDLARGPKAVKRRAEAKNRRCRIKTQLPPASVHKAGNALQRGTRTLARLYTNGIFRRRSARRLQRNGGSRSMTQSTMRLTVNGRIHDVDAAPDTALLYVLRNDLELNGPKYGCGLGECGACAVLIDGVAARSCVIPIEGCVGRDIVTLEGLGTREHPDPVQEAFIDEQAAQCGYCLNGMIISDQGAADAQSASVRSRGAGSAALQSVPLRRAYRDHARGDARRRPCRRGARLMTAPDTPRIANSRTDRCPSFVPPRPARPSSSRPSSGSLPTARSPPITAMSISAPASAPRSARSSPKSSTCPLRASSWCSAIPRCVPNQGATIASETIQITAVPLRKAAAQARQFLVARAAERLELPVEDLVIEDGLIAARTIAASAMAN